MMGNIPEFEGPFLCFVQYHRAQLISSGVPEHFWPPLYGKLKNHIFDASNCFSLVKFENDEDSSDDNVRETMKVFVSRDGGIKKDNGRHIFLIDHAWMFTPNEARRHLSRVPGLLDRMMNLMGVNSIEGDKIEIVFNTMWKFNQTYSISNRGSVEDKLPLWYILDEFGSAIQHSDDPNFRVVPFAYLNEGITYSLMFPIRDILKDEEVTRDYVQGSSDDLTRKALLYPWFPVDLKYLSCIPPEPTENYFSSGHLNETLPDLNVLPRIGNRRDRLKVYSDYDYINKYLTDERFEIVHDEEEADILWYTTHFTEFENFSKENPEKFINQFPYEFVITVKDLLNIICRRASKFEKYDEETLQIFPKWLPETFNLNTELPQFISYFQRREEKKLDNHWICKPWNLARSLDTHITNNIDFIVRLRDTGPKIAQKYVNFPVLFHREDIQDGSGQVKFDIRYVLLLKSVKPLEAFVYKNFFLRFANKSFEMNNLDDYEKHFTVMNYNEETKLHRVLCHDFIEQFKNQYPAINWNDIEEKIFQMFKEMFEAAVEKEPPCGIGHSPQSRALYAADLMLSYSPIDVTIEPKLLEVNWIPDCARACEYYNDFYNDIFSLLFLNEERDVFKKL